MSTVHIRTTTTPVRKSGALAGYLDGFSTTTLPCAVQVEEPNIKGKTVFKVVKHRAGVYTLVNLTNPKNPVRNGQTVVYKDSVIPLCLSEVLAPVARRAEVERKVGELMKSL